HDARHGQLVRALDRLVEHVTGEIDAGEPARRRIQRQVQSGADADFEHGVVRRESEVRDGSLAAGCEDPVEDEIVDGGQQLVRALDLPLLQRYVHVPPPSGGPANRLTAAVYSARSDVAKPRFDVSRPGLDR